MSEPQSHESFALDALRRGDRAEFARLVETYSPMIYRLGLKMLANPQDAEDLLQETFLKAYRYLKDFDGRSSLSTWLYRIAINEALMVLRRKQPEVISIDEPSQEDAEDQEPLQIVDWCCLPEEELLSAEGRTVLDRAMEKLSPLLRAVFVLRDIEGLSTRQVAQALNLSEAVVKTRLSRARLRLRQELSAYYGLRLEREEHA
jgi:RNA polymerase sigma-70 factor (ECF subfamily)